MIACLIWEEEQHTQIHTDTHTAMSAAFLYTLPPRRVLDYASLRRPPLFAGAETRHVRAFPQHAHMHRYNAYNALFMT